MPISKLTSLPFPPPAIPPFSASGQGLVASVNQLIDTSVASLKSLPTNPQADTVYDVIGFYAGSTVGGGKLVWQPSANKSLHNGVTYYAPEAIAAWAGTQADIATLLNWTSSGSGVFVRVLSDYPAAEMAGAVGDGAADDTLCISKALSVESTQLTAYARYRTTGRIDLPSGRWLLGNRTSVIEMDGNQFNGTATPYASNTLGFLFNGLTAAGGLYGFQIKLVNQTDELIAGAVAIRSCSDINIVDVEMSGFRKAKVIAIDSSTNCVVSENYIHDCLLASATTGQMTGIDIDNNRVGGVASVKLQVIGNTISNLICSAGFITSFGNQTDAINVSHASSTKHIIDGNIITNVGEGVDCFGSNCTISNNRIYDAYNIGIKIIHGASRCSITENKIFNPGLCGISLTGIGTAPTDTELNDVSNNFISGVNSAGNWTLAANAGIRIDNDNTTKYAKRNFVKNNTIVNCASMKYGTLLDTGSRDNEVEENKVESFLISEFTDSGTGNTKLTGAWYKTGNWTPVFQGSVTPGTLTYAEQVGRYTRLGNTVTVWGRLEISAITVAMAGELEIIGLPFTSLSGGMLYSIAIAQYGKMDLSAGYTQLTGRLLNNSSKITLIQNGDNVLPVTLNPALASVGTSIIFSCTYLVP